MIDHKKLRTIANYVAIKLDDAYDSYQIKGRETGIMAPDHEYENDSKTGKQRIINRKEKHVAVFGTVISVPQKLIFNRARIRKISDRTTVFKRFDEQIQVVCWSSQKKIDSLRSESLEYDTDIEISVGEKVNFSYRHFIEAQKNGMYADTDIGEVVFIKYDMLKLVVDEDMNPIRMLNGYVLVEPELIEVKTEGAMSYVDTEGGLVIAGMNEKYKKSRKNQIGKVYLSGTPVKGYLNDYDTVDPDLELNEGDRIMYDPRGSQKLENEIHQVLSEKDLYIVRRRHIWLVQENCTNFDDIGLERLT